MILRPKPLLSPIAQLLWATIGLFLTVISTFVEVKTTNQPWYWHSQGVSSYTLGVTYQIGAVLFTGCVGGKNAGVIAQIAYITLGLSGLSIFAQGGGFDYIWEPGFGYLLGFIPGAWVAGWFAWREKASVELSALGSGGGLLVIHLVGLIYLLIFYLFKIEPINSLSQLKSFAMVYSLNALPGHLAIVCLVAVLSYFFRRILFY